MRVHVGCARAKGDPVCPLSALKRVLTSVFLKNLWHCSQRRTIHEERALSVGQCIAKIPLDSARSLLMPSVDALNNAMSVRALCASTCLCATFHSPIDVEHFTRPSMSSILQLTPPLACSLTHRLDRIARSRTHRPTRPLARRLAQSLSRSISHPPINVNNATH